MLKPKPSRTKRMIYLTREGKCRRKPLFRRLRSTRRSKKWNAKARWIPTSCKNSASPERNHQLGQTRWAIPKVLVNLFDLSHHLKLTRHREVKLERTWKHLSHNPVLLCMRPSKSPSQMKWEIPNLHAWRSLPSLRVTRLWVLKETSQERLKLLKVLSNQLRWEPSRLRKTWILSERGSMTNYC